MKLILTPAALKFRVVATLETAGPFLSNYGTIHEWWLRGGGKGGNVNRCRYNN